MTHPSEEFHQNEGFYFSDTPAETEKNFSLGFVVVQNIGSLKPCHVLLKKLSENAFVYR